MSAYRTAPLVETPPEARRWGVAALCLVGWVLANCVPLPLPGVDMAVLRETDDHLWLPFGPPITPLAATLSTVVLIRGIIALACHGAPERTTDPVASCAACRRSRRSICCSFR